MHRRESRHTCLRNRGSTSVDRITSEPQSSAPASSAFITSSSIEHAITASSSNISAKMTHFQKCRKAQSQQRKHETEWAFFVLFEKFVLCGLFCFSGHLLSNVVCQMYSCQHALVNSAKLLAGNSVSFRLHICILVYKKLLGLPSFYSNFDLRKISF